MVPLNRNPETGRIVGLAEEEQHKIALAIVKHLEQSKWKIEGVRQAKGTGRI